MSHFIEKISRLLYHFLLEQGMDASDASIINVLANVIILLVALFFLDKLLRILIVSSFSIFSSKTKTSFDNYLVKGNFPKYIAHIIPYIIIDLLIPILFVDFPDIMSVLTKITEIYLITLIVWIFRSMIKATGEFLKNINSFKDKPVDSFVQVIIIIIWCLGIIAIYSVVMGKPISEFITTLGAASAIIILLFKDIILGFIASIQVSLNDMVHIEDWITMDKYGADGNVIEINLTTVKVQNFDNTITTIPTYKLISDSFTNWRGMEKSSGRRIKRSLLIKANSIQFLEVEQLETLKKIDYISEYISHRQKDVDDYNTKNKIDKSLLINGRNQTNLGLFRKYIDMYLHHHTAIHKEMIIMVRQLQPTAQGVPLEVYAFSKDKEWENYEYIMADIFDHLLAALPYFYLEYFEQPSSQDINNGLQSFVKGYKKP